MSSITIQPGTDGVDSTMEQEAPTTNYGQQANAFDVGEDNTFVQLFRSCAKFSFLNIPSNSVINSAILTLTYQQDGNWRSSNSRTVRVYRSLRAFTEGLTWNTYDGTNNWGTAGAGNTTTDREATDIGSATLSTTALAGDTVSITLTASAIEAMIPNGTFTNNGFILKVDTESSDRFKFQTSEGSTASERPKIVIDYTSKPRGMIIF